MTLTFVPNNLNAGNRTVKKYFTNLVVYNLKITARSQMHQVFSLKNDSFELIQYENVYDP